MKNISPLSTVWLRHLLDVHQQPLQILLWKNRQHNTPQTHKQTNNTVNQQRPGRIQIRQTKKRNFNIFKTESEWNPDEAAVAAEGAPVWSSSPGPGCAATGGGREALWPPGGHWGEDTLFPQHQFVSVLKKQNTLQDGLAHSHQNRRNVFVYTTGEYNNTVELHYLDHLQSTKMLKCTRMQEVASTSFQLFFWELPSDHQIIAGPPNGFPHILSITSSSMPLKTKLWPFISCQRAQTHPHSSGNSPTRRAAQRHVVKERKTSVKR